MGTTLNFITMLNVDAFGAIHDVFILSSHDNGITIARYTTNPHISK